jgi:alpha-beta hydrolase superfamily lysophospholipase
VPNKYSLLLSAVSFLFRYGFFVLAMPSPAFGKDNRASKSDFPFSSKYIEVRGARMPYVETGKGDPILLLHGNPTNVYIWRNIIPHLAKHGRVIAVDLIGFGKSDRPDIEYRFSDHAAYLEGFIEKMGLRNITLVTHDWGSALGFDYASRHENNVRALAFFEALLVPVPSLDEWPNQKAVPRVKGEKWMRLQDELARLSTNSVHLVNKTATHGIAREQPEFVIAAIRKALQLAVVHQTELRKPGLRLSGRISDMSLNN